MALKDIIGRKREIAILDSVWKSSDPEFLALYGRRRVGKTYLIRQFFSEKGFFLETAGSKDKPMKTQIANFMKALSTTFYHGTELKNPHSWEEAFELLTKNLSSIPKSKKIVIFFDELPWMATKRSGLLQSIDHYWNLHWSKMKNIIFITCGSAASWMLDKLIYAKGGLHKRITRKILLEPFNLQETREFLKSRSIKLNEKQILDVYMAIGGIPFYLKAVQKGLSASQIIDEICFDKNGLLHNEFVNLFESLFTHSGVNLAIVKGIVKNGNCLSREEIIAYTGVQSGGTLNDRLRELEISGFIQGFVPYGKKSRGHYFRVVDEFSLFHLYWIEPLLQMRGFQQEHYWQRLKKTPSVSSWRGQAYENVCLKHTAEIRKGLGLNDISCQIGSWRYIPKKGSKETGAQIDLLFDREDGIVNLCEIKYSEHLFSIDKSYAKQLANKIDVFERHFPTNKQIFISLITTEGLRPSIWSEDLVSQVIDLKALFK
ncbi:MAG: ATP-binding protein [Candidatus Protochlamydia sp.]|nr:ATP-binding protein [Candidatus Protochlamydia sp.]